MADETNPPNKPKKIHRLQIGVNVMVQIAIVIVLAAMVNYLGFEHYRRWDFSRDKKYALSDKTKHFLEGIEREGANHRFLWLTKSDHTPMSKICSRNISTRPTAQSTSNMSIRNVTLPERRIFSINTKW